MEPGRGRSLAGQGPASSCTSVSVAMAAGQVWGGEEQSCPTCSTRPWLLFPAEHPALWGSGRCRGGQAGEDGWLAQQQGCGCGPGIPVPNPECDPPPQHPLWGSAQLGGCWCWAEGAHGGAAPLVLSLNSPTLEWIPGLDPGISTVLGCFSSSSNGFL